MWASAAALLGPGQDHTAIAQLGETPEPAPSSESQVMQRRDLRCRRLSPLPQPRPRPGQRRRSGREPRSTPPPSSSSLATVPRPPSRRADRALPDSRGHKIGLRRLPHHSLRPGPVALARRRSCRSRRSSSTAAGSTPSVSMCSTSIDGVRPTPSSTGPTCSPSASGWNAPQTATSASPVSAFTHPINRPDYLRRSLRLPRCQLLPRRRPQRGLWSVLAGPLPQDRRRRRRGIPGLSLLLARATRKSGHQQHRRPRPAR